MPFTPPFTAIDAELISEEVAFKGFFTLSKKRFRHKKFNGGWTSHFEREIFVKGEAAAAVLYDPLLDKIGLIQQFRAGALHSQHGPWCLEVVAGLADHNEPTETLIKREIEEEAGITDAQLIPITAYYSTPGCCDEKIHLFCALVDLSGGDGVFGLSCEHEDIQLRIFDAQQVFNVMLNSRMNNAATLIALLWLQLNRPALRTTAHGASNPA